MFGSEHKELMHAQKLLNKGRFEEALQVLEGSDKPKELKPVDLLACHLLKSTTLIRLAKFEEALQLAELASHESQKLDQPLQQMDALIVQAEALWRVGKLDDSYRKIEQGEQALETLTQELTTEVAPREAALLYHKSIIHRERGDFDRALEFINQCLRIREKIGDKKTIGDTLNVIGSIYVQKGELDIALGYHERSLTIRETLDNSRDTAGSLNNLGVIYYHKGELDAALEYFERTLVVFEAIGNLQDLTSPLINIGSIYFQKGELNTALEYFERTLAVFETIDNSQGIGTSLNSIGNIYAAKGELDTALEYYERSLAIRETIDNPQDLAYSLNNIGEVYRAKGDLEIALEYYERSLAVFETTGNPRDIAGSLSNIGSIYHQRGNWNTAQDYFKRGLGLCRTIGNDIDTASTLFALLRLALDQQDQVQAQAYLKELQELQVRTPNKYIHLGSRLGEALVLKRSPRMKQKSQAQIILEELIKEDIIDFEATALALIHLCDLLLMELKLSGQPEVLQEVNVLTQRLLGSAEQQKSYWLLIETYVLQSRLALLELNLQKAQELLDQAQAIAEEKGLQRLAIKISSERDQFQAKLSQWEQLVARQAPLTERLELVQLEILLTRMAQKKAEITEAEAVAYARKTKPFEAYDGFEPFIFTSYCHSNKNQVYPEIHRLHQAGYRIWYDEGIRPGVSWRSMIAKALEQCSFFVVFLSPHAVLSTHVTKEIFFALDEKKPFLTIYLKKTELTSELKLELRPIQALMKFELSDSEYYSKLTKMLPPTLRDPRASGSSEE